jgi:hypothetical protein
MVIGLPKEIKEQESRVALLPSGVYQLAKRGHGKGSRIFIVCCRERREPVKNRFNWPCP